MDETTSHVVAFEDGTWVTTTDGPVKLEQGDTLPENVSADETARLVNAGILEGFERVDVEGAGDLPDPSNLAELKARVGDDHETAQRYLEQETARDNPRSTRVDYLEGVIAAAGADDTVHSTELEGADGTRDAGSVGVVDNEGAGA